MLKFKLLNINLRTFDGSAGAGAGAGTASGGEGTASLGQNGADGSTTTIKADLGKSGSSRRSRNSGEYSNVVFGKQPNTENPAAEGSTQKGNTDVSTSSDTLDAKKAAFEALINGEYKDLFTERTQDIINRRFKETKSYEAKLLSQQPVIDMLMDKYKITDGDVSKLKDAIDKDDRYWEEAAEEAGLSVEQYKQVQKLKRENDAFKKAQRNAYNQQQADARINMWAQQAEETKAIYQGFDLRNELKNPEFAKMLQSGIPVKQAYEVMHIDELVTGAAKVAAEKAEKNTVAKIQSKASRPAENGTSSSSSVIVKNDVSKLTKADRAEAIRRAARGDIISF